MTNLRKAELSCQIHCQTVTEGVSTIAPWNFSVAYDKLVIASGAQASTFGIKGALEHATFLREVHHAQEIRRKLLLNLMLSDVPGMAKRSYYILVELCLKCHGFSDFLLSMGVLKQVSAMKRSVGSFTALLLEVVPQESSSVASLVTSYGRMFIKDTLM